MQRLLQDAAQRASRYLESIGDRPVRPDPGAVSRLAELEVPLPADGVAAAEVLKLLDERVSPATMATAGPRFFGFVIGGALPASVAANWLATAWDQNTGFYRVTPGVCHLEQVALAWLRDLFGLPAGTAAAFVTGATMANFTALAAARHAVLKRVGWAVESDGLFGAPPITVIVGEEAHPTVHKALGLLGMGRKRVVRVPVDSQGRMRAEALPRIAGPTIVCLQAGNVNTGAVDPLEPLARAAKEAGAWVHVDGAFGLWAATAPGRSYLTAGVGLADSWATDAHKWLNVPYDSGLAFVRDPDALRASMAVTAEYLPSESPQRNSSDYTPEFSRRARGVDVWAALLSLGRKGVAEMIERNCRQARRFAELLSAAGHRVLNDVVLNQVLVSFGSPERTLRVIDAIQEDGTCWAGSTVWQGHTAMRISVCSAATTDADVERSAAAMVAAARSVPGG
ncbi:MAG TPA: aminotransferase class V-fold PLP-dependent enzyme [Gammaproteobacteria bacterium]|jgi:glutamate/tyrosine decarboxylase-like PLP-dependent enzyme|nr:aminotransferase class V-fold PLP-dependent enzyme [Gammaproteobacteria bacterium]